MKTIHILRNQAHEYFHGLGSTWTHATKSPLYGHAYILESLAATATRTRTCSLA